MAVPPPGLACVAAGPRTRLDHEYSTEGLEGLRLRQPVDVRCSKMPLLELMIISWNCQMSPSLNNAGLVFNYLLYEINRVCKSV